MGIKKADAGCFPQVGFAAARQCLAIKMPQRSKANTLDTMIILFLGIFPVDRGMQPAIAQNRP
jgi:hypothetical protein